MVVGQFETAKPRDVLMCESLTEICCEVLAIGLVVARGHATRAVGFAEHPVHGLYTRPTRIRTNGTPHCVSYHRTQGYVGYGDGWFWFNKTIQWAHMGQML